MSIPAVHGRLHDLCQDPQQTQGGDQAGVCRSRALFSRVGMWRGGVRSGLSVAAPFVWRCPSILAVATVSTPPSSNPAGPIKAPGSRTSHHDFAHGRFCVDFHRRMSPSSSWKYSSGYSAPFSLSVGQFSPFRRPLKPAKSSSTKYNTALNQ